MLELRNITKDYEVGDDKVHALKGVNLAFGKSGMVSILGQSGCGKTTLLNIIGGLDRYTSGDLVINGRSTVYFKPSDWDAYRNQKIGFVFQSYNLIPHLTVLGNVELALTLSGIKKAERRERAIEALRMVGLEGEIKKRPNQMSGGQMQRVAIARAIVNNPDIILADEPTGALDSTTSLAVMEILKDISKERLVIMVTHNQTLAETYSTRIISMLDGEVKSDTAPVAFEGETVAPTGCVSDNTDGTVADKAVTEDGEQKDDTPPASQKEVHTDKADDKQLAKLRKKEQKAITKANRAALRRTSMSLFTAFGLSARNLITKKGRTIATAIAGSIGIIGVALVLALSNGFNGYIEDMQTSMLAHYPVTASTVTIDMESAMESMENMSATYQKFPDGNKVIVKADKMTAPFHYNRFTPEFLAHVDKIPSNLAIDVTRDYGAEKHVLSAHTSNGYGAIGTSTSSMNAMIGTSSASFQQLLNNSDYVKSQYDVLSGKYPTAADEIAIVIGNDNTINAKTLRSAGIDYPVGEQSGKDAQVPFDYFIGQQLKLVHNNEWFQKDENGIYRTFSSRYDSSNQAAWKELYDNPNNFTLKVVGVMRVKESAALALFSSGLVYTPELNNHFLQDCKVSEVAKAQLADKTKYISNATTNALDTVIKPMLGDDEDISFAGRDFNDEKLMRLYALSKLMKIDITADDIYEQALQAVGASDMPANLNFYPVSFSKKTEMMNYVNKYNKGKTDAQQILMLDMASLVTDTVSDMIDIISYVLIAFAAISLLVSSVMISIITYASVAERIKEIGVLRSVGARKADIMRVFIAETVIIGFVAGIIGVLFTLIVSFPLSSLFISISDGVVTSSLVVVSWWHALLLIGISVVLTFIAGMLPARSASRKDPVVALRTE
ncbi:MAG: ABC transporter ATP-binding protein/permease [Clostridiales bacterium]|nr:ABC transporter ATP-binding protein/permease [Clostridiales bacterium]